MGASGRDLLTLAVLAVFLIGTAMVVVVMLRVLPFWWWGPPSQAVTAASGLALGVLTGDDACG